MKSIIALVYFFYLLITGATHQLIYPRPVHSIQINHGPHARVYHDRQTQSIYDPFQQQPQRNNPYSPTLATIQQHAGFLFKKPPQKALPGVTPTVQVRQQNHGWRPVHRLAPQRPTLPVPQLQSYRSPPWSQPRSSKANYNKVLKELGLKTVAPATLTTPFEKKKSEPYLGTFFQPPRPQQQQQQYRPPPPPPPLPVVPRRRIEQVQQIIEYPQQINQVAPVVNDFYSYRQAILNKNYRDDKTHEPYWHSSEPERDDTYEGFPIERTEEEKAPISDHEYPKEIPTRPIYPGQGQWAKPGVKHRPYVSTQTYTTLEDDDDIGRRPEGYDTFLEAERLFKDQERTFQKGINAPVPFGSYGRTQTQENDWSEEVTEEKSNHEFQPLQVYAQVRKIDEELYLPENKAEPSLTEEINDSKIHTIYTEEGYEDSAYDHAGHEKKAELDEGDHHSKDKYKTKHPKKYYKETYIPPPEYDDEEEDDASGDDANVAGSAAGKAMVKMNDTMSDGTDGMTMVMVGDGKTMMVMNDTSVVETDNTTVEVDNSSKSDVKPVVIMNDTMIAKSDNTPMMMMTSDSDHGDGFTKELAMNDHMINDVVMMTEYIIAESKPLIMNEDPVEMMGDNKPVVTDRSDDQPVVVTNDHANVKTDEKPAAANDRITSRMDDTPVMMMGEFVNAEGDGKSVSDSVPVNEQVKVDQPVTSSRSDDAPAAVMNDYTNVETEDKSAGSRNDDTSTTNDYMDSKTDDKPVIMSSSINSRSGDAPTEVTDERDGKALNNPTDDDASEVVVVKDHSNVEREDRPSSRSDDRPVEYYTTVKPVVRNDYASAPLASDYMSIERDGVVTYSAVSANNDEQPTPRNNRISSRIDDEPVIMRNEYNRAENNNRPIVRNDYVSSRSDDLPMEMKNRYSNTERDDKSTHSSANDENNSQRDRVVSRSDDRPVVTKNEYRSAERDDTRSDDAPVVMKNEYRNTERDDKLRGMDDYVSSRRDGSSMGMKNHYSGSERDDKPTHDNANDENNRQHDRINSGNDETPMVTKSEYRNAESDDQPRGMKDYVSSRSDGSPMGLRNHYSNTERDEKRLHSSTNDENNRQHDRISSRSDDTPVVTKNEYRSAENDDKPRAMNDYDNSRSDGSPMNMRNHYSSGERDDKLTHNDENSRQPDRISSRSDDTPVVTKNEDTSDDKPIVVSDDVTFRDDSTPVRMRNSYPNDERMDYDDRKVVMNDRIISRSDERPVTAERDENPTVMGDNVNSNRSSNAENDNQPEIMNSRRNDDSAVLTDDYVSKIMHHLINPENDEHPPNNSRMDDASNGDISDEREARPSTTAENSNATVETINDDSKTQRVDQPVVLIDSISAENDGTKVVMMNGSSNAEKTKESVVAPNEPVSTESNSRPIVVESSESTSAEEDAEPNETSNEYNSAEIDYQPIVTISTIRNVRTHTTKYTESSDPEEESEPQRRTPSNKVVKTSSTSKNKVKRDVEAQTLKVQTPPLDPLEADSSASTDDARLKRYIIDWPNIDIDTSFLDKLIEEQRRPRRRKPLVNRKKYPYYYSRDLPENSPLRYAENLNNIPKKREGNMAFYDQADRRKRCAEVEDDVDPVPDRIKNAEDQEEPADVAELPDVPRLRGLGDKIDCFKAKYFGADPFDSPIFKEKQVGKPLPIFDELVDNSVEDASASEVHAKVIKENEIKESNEPAPTEKNPTESESEIVESTEPPKPVVPSLITTPSYTLKFTPKHIYDQIHLLDYLPSKNNESLPVVTTAMSATEAVSINETTTTESAITTTTTTESSRVPKAIPLQTQVASDRSETVQPHEPELLVIAINERSDSEPVEEEKEIETATTVPVAEETTPTTEAVEEKPKAQPLRKIRRRKRPRPPVNTQPNKFEIFDINDFLPPPLPSQYTFVDQATAKTKQKPVISEVQYKEEIKPSEQLNVFEDVINNIRNTPTEATQKAEEVTVGDVQTNRPHTRRIKKVKPTSTRKIRIKNPVTDTQTAGAENVEIVGHGVAVNDTTIVNPKFGDRKPTRSVESSFGGNENVPPGQHHKVYKPVGQHVVRFSQTSKTPVSEEPTLMTNPNNDNTEEHVTQVLGLVPPDNWQYKTIYNADNPEKRPNETVLNTYPVVGMKPPPANQRVLTYADFKAKAPLRRVHHHLVKRDALRSRYTEIKRNNNKNNTDAEEAETDDYVPRRPTNFHYDVEQARIVYNNRRMQQTSDSNNAKVRDVATSTTSTTVVPATTKKPEMNWFEYIKLLKSNDQYIEIPEPKPTEKQDVTTTTAAPVQISQGTITSPEFLSLIAKLKQDKNYMIIEEPKQSNKKTTTVAPTRDVEVEAEESIDYKHVQNSPGVQIFEVQQSDKLTADVDPENKVKNYTPKTTIDTSKYKTIERPRLGTTTEEVTVADRRMDSTNPLEESEAQLSTPELSSQAPTTTTSTTTSEPSTPKHRRVLSTKLSGTLRVPTPPKPSPKPRRPTSLYARTTTPKTSTTTTTTVETTKTFFKRRFNRTRVPSTTERIQPEAKNKTLMRRHQSDVPINHKPIFTPLVKTTQSSGLTLEGSNQVNIQVTPRTVTADILYQTENLTSNLKKHEIRPRKVADVEIIKKFDKNHKHGGNYKKEEDLDEESKIIDSTPQKHQIIPRKIDDKPKTSNDQINADNVEIIASFDKTKKHGGNYKADEEAQDTAAIGVVNRANDNLTVQRRNFRRKMFGSSTTVQPAVANESPKEDVEVIGDYDEDKKTGGNYKTEEDVFKAEVDTLKSDDYSEEDTSATDAAEDSVIPVISDVPFPNKIRRNSKRKVAVADAASPQQLEKPDKDVEILAEFDKTKKHGGNLKSEEKAETTEETATTKVTVTPNRRHFRRNALATSTDPVVVSRSKNRNYEYEIFEPYEGNRRRDNDHRSHRGDSVRRTSQETPRSSNPSNGNRPGRHFRQKVSVTSVVKNTVIRRPKQRVEGDVEKEYEEVKKNAENNDSEDTSVEAATKPSTTTTTSKAEAEFAATKDENKKVENSNKSVKNESITTKTDPTETSKSVRGHFKETVSVKSAVSVNNTDTSQPDEKIEEVVKHYDDLKKQQENNKSAKVNADAVSKGTTTTPKAQADAVDQNQKKDVKTAKEESQSTNHSEQTTETTKSSAARRNFRTSSKVSSKDTVTPQPTKANVQEHGEIKNKTEPTVVKKHFRTKVTVTSTVPNKNVATPSQDNKKSQSKTVEATTEVVKTTPKADVEVIKPMDEKKKHGGNYKEESESKIAKESIDPVLTATAKPNAARRHLRRKVSISSAVSNKNTVTPQPKEQVEVMADYDKSKKHGGNYKPEDSGAEETEVTTSTPKSSVEVIAPIDEEKKHGGNYKPAKEYHYNDDVSIVVEETVLPKVIPDADGDTVKRQFRRRVSVNSEAIDKNGVIHKPKDDVEVMKDYDKSKKHGGNFKAEIAADTEETTTFPKTEVEAVGSIDEEKKHGGNYKPADEDVDDGEIPIEAAESALPKIAELPAVNRVKQHTRRRAFISAESLNKLTTPANPNEEVEIFKDYDKTQKHGGNYREEKENVETATTTQRNAVTPRRQTRRRSTIRAPTTKRSVSSTTDVTTTSEALAEEPKLSTTETSSTTTKASETTRSVRSQRTRARARNIVANQRGRPNDVEVIKDYDKTKKHGGNYKWEGATANRGRIRQNKTETNDVEVFANYNKTQKTGGNYRRQRTTTTTSTTNKPETSLNGEDLDEIEQLTDAVPKPYSFYTDSKLPDNVNHLDDSSSNEKDGDESSTDDYFVGEESRVPATTNKPLFIKDPKKRKYFYAPVK